MLSFIPDENYVIMLSVKCTRTHVYYCMKNSPLTEDDFREDLLNVVDHYQVQLIDKFYIVVLLMAIVKLLLLFCNF